MSDKSLDILIRTKAELSGAKALEEQLQRDIGKTKALGQAHDELSAKLAAVQGSIKRATEANEELGEGFRLGAEHAEFLGLKHKQLHRLVHQLGEAFPLAGLAARAFLNPVMLAATLAVGAFAKVKESIAELNKTLDEMEASNAKPIGNMAESMREAAMEVTTGLQAWQDHLQDLIESETSLTTKTNAATEALRAQERALLEITDAREALALKMIDDQEKRHKADPKQGLDEVAAEKARLAVREAYDKQRREIKDTADKKSIGLKEEELAKREGRTHDLLTQAHDDKMAVHDFKRVSDRIDMPKRAKDAEEEYKKATTERIKRSAEVDEAQDNVDELSRFPRTGPSVNLSVAQGKLKEAKDALEMAAAKERNWKNSADRAYDSNIERTGEQKALEHKAEKSQQKLDENTKAIDELRIEIAKLNEVSTIDHGAREKVGRLHTATRAMELSAKEAEVDASEEKKSHEQERRQLLNQPGSVGTLGKGTEAADHILEQNNQVLEILSVLVPGMKAAKATLDKLETDVSDLKDWGKGSRNR